MQINENTQQLSSVVQQQRTLPQASFFFTTDLVRDIVWKSIAGLAKLDYCRCVQKRTLRRPVSMETQTGHDTALRWILCVTPTAELVHLGFIFFLVYIFLFLFFSFTFTPTVQQRAPSPTPPSLSFTHSLSVSLPPTGSRAKIREKI